MNCKPTYIYALVDPRNDTIRYVGKTVQIRVRYKQHCQPMSNSRNSYKRNWLKSLLPLIPRIEILETVPIGGNWVEREIFWISYCKFLGYKLTNLTKGGDGLLGYVFTDEHRAKMSIANTGKKQSEETLAKLSKIRKGKNTGKKVPLSLEHKESLSKAQLLRYERERELGITQKGKVMSKETCDKMSEHKKGTKVAPEVIEKRLIVYHKTMADKRILKEILQVWSCAL